MSEPAHPSPLVLVPEERPNWSRRDFIKSVIATGSTVSGLSYFGTGAVRAQTAGAERLLTLSVNGQSRRVDVLPHETLTTTLRYKLGLTGTKLGCDRAECGACTVHVDGEPVQSCVTTLSEVEGSDITTIEGLSDDGSHPVQKAWKEHSVPQCGYCQAGQIMMAAALLESNKDPSDDEIDSHMWNMCRCGTYNRIREAIKDAAKEVNQ